ncbi:MAG: ribose-5-phosphate isomerase RpiA [Candidatus Bathyarchaeota archaeon]|nr:ribose-5-phosphate isomerase RpiA [Candidatus Bathyarchaeota archaeon]
MVWRESAKKRAALEAVKHVEDGFILGLGTGSTAAFAVKEIGRRIKEENLHVLGVSTSHQTLLLAVECGVPITTLDEHPQLDLDIDGADQIDADLNLIKGGGGALTREKVVATASKKLIIVADETKLADSLGENVDLPVEVLPFAVPVVLSRVRAMGGKPVLRKKQDKSEPYVTDNGNFILDVNFGTITDLSGLESKLKSIPGIIETGLFIGMAETVYIGTRTTVRTMQKEM